MIDASYWRIGVRIAFAALTIAVYVYAERRGKRG
jgi:hypothetical protein